MEIQSRTYPDLVFLDRSLEVLTADFDDDATIFIVDNPQRERLRALRNLVIVDSNCVSHVQAMALGKKTGRIVGVGACAALDVARACASNFGAQLILIPTFLSTSCISVDRSVLRYDGKYRSSVTRAPSKVFILDEFLDVIDNPLLLRAARAGFGDFFAGISAAIDYSRLHGDCTLERVSDLAGFYFSGIRWVLQHFSGYNRRAMRRLARYSHTSSLMVIKRGDTALSAGGEHRLYYNIMENHLYDIDCPPLHGELVAVGTLISLWAFSQAQGHYELFADFRRACVKLGLPVDMIGLQKIGLPVEKLETGLGLMAREDCLISVTLRDLSAETLIRKVFDEQTS